MVFSDHKATASNVEEAIAHLVAAM